MFVLPVKKRLETFLHGIVALHVTRTEAAQAPPFLLPSRALVQSRRQLPTFRATLRQSCLCQALTTLSCILNNTGRATPQFHGNNKFTVKGYPHCHAESFKRSFETRRRRRRRKTRLLLETCLFSTWNIYWLLTILFNQWSLPWNFHVVQYLIDNVVASWYN